MTNRAAATPHTDDLPMFDRIEEAAGREAVVAHLTRVARAVRRRDIQMVHEAGQGHIGGEFSVIDILVTLYFHVMNVTPERPEDSERDRLILSKGHAAAALYTVLAARGYFDDAELKTFARPLSRLNGHPARTKVAAIEASTGPLGHGLPIAVGVAIAAQLDGSPRRTFVVLGDGELQEGSNWEALMTAGNRRLDRLVAVVDRNRLQQGAVVSETNDLEPLAEKARAFGWDVHEVDGHDYAALIDVFTAAPSSSGRPTFVIAHTHKGHPVSFMRDQVSWHHKVPSAEHVEIALSELGTP